MTAFLSIALSAAAAQFAPGLDLDAFSLADPYDEVLAAESPAMSPREVLALEVGPRAGILRRRGAERGTWLGGAQARMWFLEALGAEASISVHRSRFKDEDLVVWQYPVEVTGFISPFPDFALQPYGLVGTGWYYTRFDFEESTGIEDDTQHIVGVHVGGGAELRLGSRTVVDADVRYIWLNTHLRREALEAVSNRDFDYWQATAAVNFRF